MNMNAISSQNPTQTYRNNQADAPRSTRQDTKQAASNSATKVDISQKAKDLQAQRLQDQQETKEAESTADNEQTEQTQATRQQASNVGNQTQATASSQNTINVLA